MKYLHILLTFLCILLADCTLYGIIIGSVDIEDAERELLNLPKQGITFTDVLGMTVVIIISIVIFIELTKLIINGRGK